MFIGRESNHICVSEYTEESSLIVHPRSLQSSRILGQQEFRFYEEL
jgi:hypothetical protein